MRHEASSAAHVLNSWKEISAHLGRGVRTVQRWERLYQLPVYRVGKGQRSPVFAYTSELSLWLRNISRNQIPAHRVSTNPVSTNPVSTNQASLNHTRPHLVADRGDGAHPVRPHVTLELVGHSSRLTHNLLVLTAQHQRRTETLMQTVDRITHHFRTRRKRTALQTTDDSLSNPQPNFAEEILPVSTLPRKPKPLSTHNTAR